MKKPRLASRIREALRLQPMTIHQLAQCLSVSDQSIQQSLASLGRRRIVRRRDWVQRPRGAAHLFELRQFHPLNARGHMKIVSVRVGTEANWVWQPAQGYEIGPFVVHKAVDGRNDWVATHAATGFAVIRHPTVEVCERAVDRFLALPVDWNFTERSVVAKWPKHVLAMVNEIRFSSSESIAA